MSYLTNQNNYDHDDDGSVKRLSDLTEDQVGSCKRLECRVIGFPRPCIRWYKDGVNITSHRRYKFDCTREGYIVLIIENFSPKDQGLYQCMAENAAGMASTYAKLNVKGAMSVKTEQTTSTHSMTSDDSDGAKISRQSQKRPLVMEGGKMIEETVEEVEITTINKTTRRTVEDTLERTVISYTDTEAEESHLPSARKEEIQLLGHQVASQMALETSSESNIQRKVNGKLKDSSTKAVTHDIQDIASPDSGEGSDVMSKDAGITVAHVVEVDSRDEQENELRALTETDRNGDSRSRRWTADSGILSRGSSMSSEQELNVTQDSVLEMQEYFHGRADVIYQSLEREKNVVVDENGSSKSTKISETISSKQEASIYQTNKPGDKQPYRANETSDVSKLDCINENQKSVLAGKYLFAEGPSDELESSDHLHSEFELISHTEMTKSLGTDLTPEKLQSKLHQYILEQKRARVSEESHVQESTSKRSKTTRRTTDIPGVDDEDDSAQRVVTVEGDGSVVVTTSSGTPSVVEPLELDASVEDISELSNGTVDAEVETLAVTRTEDSAQVLAKSCKEKSSEVSEDTGDAKQQKNEKASNTDGLGCEGASADSDGKITESAIKAKTQTKTESASNQSELKSTTNTDGLKTREKDEDCSGEIQNDLNDDDDQSGRFLTKLGTDDEMDLNEKKKDVNTDQDELDMDSKIDLEGTEKGQTDVKRKKEKDDKLVEDIVGENMADKKKLDSLDGSKAFGENNKGKVFNEELIDKIVVDKKNLEIKDPSLPTSGQDESDAKLPGDSGSSKQDDKVSGKDESQSAQAILDRGSNAGTGDDEKEYSREMERKLSSRDENVKSDVDMSDENMMEMEQPVNKQKMQIDDSTGSADNDDFSSEVTRSEIEQILEQSDGRVLKEKTTESESVTKDTKKDTDQGNCDINVVEETVQRTVVQKESMVSESLNKLESEQGHTKRKAVSEISTEAGDEEHGDGSGQGTEGFSDNKDKEEDSSAVTPDGSTSSKTRDADKLTVTEESSVDDTQKDNKLVSDKFKGKDEKMEHLEIDVSTESSQSETKQKTELESMAIAKEVEAEVIESHQELVEKTTSKQKANITETTELSTKTISTESAIESTASEQKMQSLQKVNEFEQARAKKVQEAKMATVNELPDLSAEVKVETKLQAAAEGFREDDFIAGDNGVQRLQDTMCEIPNIINLGNLDVKPSSDVVTEELRIEEMSEVHTVERKISKDEGHDEAEETTTVRKTKITQVVTEETETTETTTTKTGDKIVVEEAKADEEEKSQRKTDDISIDSSTTSSKDAEQEDAVHADSSVDTRKGPSDENAASLVSEAEQKRNAEEDVKPIAETTITHEETVHSEEIPVAVSSTEDSVKKKEAEVESANDSKVKEKEQNTEHKSSKEEEPETRQKAEGSVNDKQLIVEETIVKETKIPEETSKEAMESMEALKEDSAPENMPTFEKIPQAAETIEELKQNIEVAETSPKDLMKTERPASTAEPQDQGDAEVLNKVGVETGTQLEENEVSEKMEKERKDKDKAVDVALKEMEKAPLSQVEKAREAKPETDTGPVEAPATCKTEEKLKSGSPDKTDTVSDKVPGPEDDTTSKLKLEMDKAEPVSKGENPNQTKTDEKLKHVMIKADKKLETDGKNKVSISDDITKDASVEKQPESTKPKPAGTCKEKTDESKVIIAEGIEEKVSVTNEPKAKSPESIALGNSTKKPKSEDVADQQVETQARITDSEGPSESEKVKAKNGIQEVSSMENLQKDAISSESQETQFLPVSKDSESESGAEVGKQGDKSSIATEDVLSENAKNAAMSQRSVEQPVEEIISEDDKKESLTQKELVTEKSPKEQNDDNSSKTGKAKQPSVSVDSVDSALTPDATKTKVSDVTEGRLDTDSEVQVLLLTSDVLVNEDEAFRIQWKIQASTTTDIQIVKDGQILYPNDRINLSCQGNVCSVDVTKAKPEDCATYAVRADNKNELYGEVTVQTLSRDRSDWVKPEFTTEPILEVIPGRKLSLKCAVTGTPEPEVTWFKRGQQLKKDDLWEVFIKDGYHCAEAAPSAILDSEIVVCRVENEAGFLQTVLDLRREGKDVKCENLSKPEATKTDSQDNMPPRLEIELSETNDQNLRLFVVAREYTDKSNCVSMDTGETIHVLASNLGEELMIRSVKNADKICFAPPDIIKELSESGKQPTSTANDVSGLELTDETSEQKNKQDEQQFYIPGDPGQADKMPERRKMKSPSPKLHSTSKKKTDDTSTEELKSRLGYKDISVSSKGSVSRDAVTMAEYEDGTTRPMFKKRLKKLVARVGEEAKLECMVAGTPLPKVLWLKNGSPLKETDGCKVIVEDETNILVFPNASEQDVGVYTARAMNVNGSVMCTAEVSLSDGKEPLPCLDIPDCPMDLDFTTPAYFFQMSSCQVAEGRLARFDCRVVAYPKPEIVWMRDGKVVESGERFKLLNFNNEIYSLLIQNVQLIDTGRYTCWARNKFGEAMTEAYLNVISLKEQPDEGDIAPKFLTRFYDQQTTETVPVDFKCLIAGRPAPSVTWLLDDIELKESPGIRMRKNEGVCSLEIKSPKLNQSGQYTCQLKNDLGEATCSARLTVVEDVLHGKMLPKFLKKFDHTTARDGEEATFTAVVVGEPKPNVSWMYDHKPIDESNRRYRIKQDGDTFTLTIKNVRFDDDGIITCKAVNEEGEVYCSANLHVRESAKVKETPDKVGYKPSKDSQRGRSPSYKQDDSKFGYVPTFTRRLQDQMVKEGNKAKFECQVMGIPEPEVSWMKDGRVILPGGRFHMKRDGVSCYLEIDNATPADGGIYTCIVANPQGKASSSAQLKMGDEKRKEKYTPERYLDDSFTTPTKRPHLEASPPIEAIPKLAYERPTLLNKRDDSVRLSWMPVTTATLPTDGRRVSYVVESKELPGKDWSRVASNIPGSTYNIRHLRPDKDYEFRVRAQNQYGVSEPTRTTHLERRADERKFVDLPEIRAPPRLPTHRPIITDLGEETVRLAWRPVETYKSKRIPPVSYRLEAKELPDKDWMPLSSRLRDTTHYLSELPPDRDYMIRVRAENDFGMSEPTEPLWLPRATAFPGVPVSRPEIVELEPTRAKLSWTRVDVPAFGLDDAPLTYMLEVEEPQTRDWRVVARDLDDTEYIVEGLRPTTDYRFRVRARSPTGVISEPSPAASLYTALARSRAPVDGLEVVQAEPDLGSVHLQWKRVDVPPYHTDDEPLMYMLEYQEPPVGDWRPLVTGIPTTRYRVTHLQPDRDYQFRVKALTPYGVSPPSAVLPVSLRPGLPVGRPIPSLQMSDVESDSVRLSWRRPMTDLAEPLLYDVEINEPPLVSWRPIATGLTDTTYRVSGLRPTRDYQFRVLPKTQTRALDYTPPVSLTTSDVRPRFHLSEPRMRELGPDSVQLTWSPAELPVYQRKPTTVYYSIDMLEEPGTNWVPVTRRVPDTTYVVTGLRPDRDYKFRVAAHTDYSSSEPSMAAVLRRRPAPVFSRDEPRIEDMSHGYVSLAWKPAEIPTGIALPPTVSYIVEIQSPPGISTWSTLYSNHPTPSIRLSDLRPDLDYLARVRAQYHDYITEPTLPVYIPRRAVPPRMSVEEPYAVDICPDSVHLQWRSADLPIHIMDYAPITYRLEAQELPGSDWVTVARGVPHTDFKVTGLNPNRDYSFRVRAENDYGLSEPTKAAVIKKRSATGTHVVPNLPHDEPLMYDVGPGCVRLAWRPASIPSYIHTNSPITYTVFCQELPHTTWRPLVRRIPHTSYFLTGLQPDREYYFRIQADNEFGSSRPTQAVYLPRLADFKRPITMPEVSEFDEDLTSVKLHWTPTKHLPLKGTPKYHVESWEPLKREWRPIARGIPDTTYYARGLPTVPDHLFRVRMETEHGLSEPSLPVSVSRYYSAPRFPVQRPQLYDLDSESVRLSWQPVPHTDARPRRPIRYVIEQREIPERTWRPVMSDVMDTSYRVTGLRPKLDYEFRVRALVDGQSSEPSYPVALYRRPVIPSVRFDTPEVYDVQDDEVSLRWRKVDIPAFTHHEEPLTYIVERQQLPNYEWETVATDLSDSTYRIKGLQPYQDYAFRVRGVYPSGYTEPSPHVPVYRRPIRLSVPISRPEVWEEEPYSARLRWHRVYVPPYHRTPLRYRVEMQEAASLSDWQPVATNITTPECTISEISPRKDYHFRIRAETEDGALSDPTPPIQYYRSQLPMSKEPFRTGDLKPIEYDVTFANRTYVEHLTKFVPPRLPIDKPEMVVIGPETVELAWKPARIPDAIRHSSNLTYAIEVRNPPSFEWRELVSGLKVLDHTLKNLHPRLDYIFRIRAWNQYGSSEPSLPVSLYRPIEYDENGEFEEDEALEREFELRFGHQVPPKLPMDTPRVTTQTPDSVWFSWLPARIPAYATQTPITYAIEVKEPPNTAWNRQVSGLVDNQYLLDNLLPTQDYHIRVRAETEFGVSDPTLPIIIQRSKASSRRSSTDSDKKSDVSVDTSYLENITGGVAPRMPSTRPRSSNVKPDSLTLSWLMGRVPSYVKNPCIDYIIEMRELPGYQWRELAADITQTSYDITGLKPDKDYMFRVKARNEFGISDPTLPMTLYRERDDYVPQTIRSRSSSRDSLFGLSGSRWSRRSSSIDYGRPEEDEVDICIRDKIPTSPDFTSPDNTQYVVEGKKGRVTVQVRGYPIPTIHWYKGAEKVDFGDNFNAYVSSTGLVTLEMKNVRGDAPGEYKCFAENEQGASSRVVKVKLADPPTVLQPLSDQVLTSRSDAKLTCVVDGTPYPTVKWMKDWRPLTESSRVKVIKDGQNVCSLQINSALSSDAGVYACVVENMAGKVTCTARLTVDEDVPGAGDIRFKTSPIQDHYHILEEIGRGRHGVVRRVVEKITGTEFAAKFINVRSKAQKDFFYNEMESLRYLNHPSLLKIRDAFETDRCLIIVTELVPGRELLDRVDSDWTEKQVAEVVKQLLEGLQHQHGQNILHLDIKPSNIFLTNDKDFNIKLIDYGLSRHMDPSIDTLQNYGTVGYASPEQILNNPVSYSSDVWGVGALTYSLLTGQSPFVGATDRDTLRNTVDGKWSLKEGSSFSPSAKDFISKILVKDPASRPSIADCLQHLWLSAPDAASNLPVEALKQFLAVDKVKRESSAVWTTARLQSFASLLRNKEEDMHPVVDRATGEVIFPDSDDYAEYIDEAAWTQWNAQYADNPDTQVFPLQDITYTLRQLARIQLDGEEETFTPIAAPPMTEDTPIMFRNKIENTTFRVGDDVTFSCSVISPEHPAVVTWYRDEQLLSDASRVSATYDDGVASLTISNAKDYDAAVYKCVARNKDGRVSCQARLMLGDIPGQPGRPVVTQVSGSEVFLTWRGPVNDGNSYILGYRVDFKQQNDLEWTRGPYVVEEYALITGLVPNTKYIFRISCHNKYGTSPYTWASLPVTTKDSDAPAVVMTTELKPLLQFGSFTKQQLILPAESRRPSLTVPGEATLHKENPKEFYNITETISKGTYGEYNLCTSRTGNQVCVMKKVAYQAENHDDVVREFEILQTLRQSNIITVVDGFVHGGMFYTVFERLSGINVVQYLSLRKWYTEDMVAQVVMQLLNAIQYLHSLQIVHLNLQPSSVVMATRRRLHIKLRDFTLARKVERPSGVTARRAGYPDFVAPEVLKGEAVSYSADMWGIGALTFVMLSGVSPFAGDNMKETASNVVFNRYFNSDTYDTVSRQAIRFVNRLLMRMPQNRATVEMCFDHRWLQLSDAVMKTRQSNVFPTDKLRAFSTEYLQRRADPQYMDLGSLDVEALPKANIEQVADKLVTEAMGEALKVAGVQ